MKEEIDTSPRNYPNEKKEWKGILWNLQWLKKRKEKNWREEFSNNPWCFIFLVFLSHSKNLFFTNLKKTRRSKSLILCWVLNIARKQEKNAEEIWKVEKKYNRIIAKCEPKEWGMETQEKAIRADRQTEKEKEGREKEG